MASMVAIQWTQLILRTITTIIWCGFQFVDIERTTVANLYIYALLATGVLSLAVSVTTLIITETHFPRYHPFLNRRMTSLQRCLI